MDKSPGPVSGAARRGPAGRVVMKLISLRCADQSDHYLRFYTLLSSIISHRVDRVALLSFATCIGLYYTYYLQFVCISIGSGAGIRISIGISTW